MTYQCSTCKKYKTRNSFYRHIRAKSGIQSACKMCQKERQRNKKRGRIKGDKLRCASCRKYKNKADFSVHRGQATGRQQYCKKCQSAYEKNRKRNVKQKDAPTEVAFARYIRTVNRYRIIPKRLTFANYIKWLEGKI